MFVRDYEMFSQPKVILKNALLLIKHSKAFSVNIRFLIIQKTSQMCDVWEQSIVIIQSAYLFTLYFLVHMPVFVPMTGFSRWVSAI